MWICFSDPREMVSKPPQAYSAVGCVSSHVEYAAKDAEGANEFERTNNEQSRDDEVGQPVLFDREETDVLTISLTSRQSLKIRQFPSSDDRWGIHSCVWDGGLALIAYLSVAKTRWEETSLIDLGSGTGIVGLGVSSLSKGRCLVALTDLEEALPLLKENVSANAMNWKYSRYAMTPIVKELAWGEAVGMSWLKKGVMRRRTDRCLRARPCRRPRRVIITGADIVYRKPLFLPLLSTIAELQARLLQIDPDVSLEVLLACQSIRSHLHEFWTTARRQNFSLELLACCRLPQQCDSVESVEVAPARQSEKRAPEAIPAQEGVVVIVRISKMPYTFNI